MDAYLADKLRNWYEALKIDGWVEENTDGHLHIELFGIAIQNLNLKRGDYVRVQVIRQEELNAEPKKRSSVTP